MTIKLSILLLSVPSRVNNVFKGLFAECCRQAEGKEVEVLALIDNKKMSIGKKRETLVQAARGSWLCFCDDDDWYDPSFVDEVLKALDGGSEPDVIVFNQNAVLDGDVPFTVRFGIENTNEQAFKTSANTWGDIKRKPFHVCVWKASIAKRNHVPDLSWSEDWLWCEQMLNEVKTQHRIDKVLHFYRYDRNKSEAPKPAGENKPMPRSAVLSVLMLPSKTEAGWVEEFLRLCAAASGRPVEILVLADNEMMPVETKKETLSSAAFGEKVYLSDSDVGSVVQKIESIPTHA